MSESDGYKIYKMCVCCLSIVKAAILDNLHVVQPVT